MRGDRVGPNDPYRILEDEDREPGQSIRDRPGEVQLADDAYRIGTVHNNMMLSPVNGPCSTYQTGCSASASFCVEERGYIIDPERSAPTLNYDYDAISSIVGRYPTIEANGHVDALGREIIDRFALQDSA